MGERPADAAPPADGRRPQLDGLRFFLFVCIFLLHHFPQQAEFLGYALPVFFVLSGFLITGVLLSIDHPRLLGRLRVFYLRRALRICPAYYVVLLLLWSTSHLTHPVYYVVYLLNVKLFALSLSPDVLGFVNWFNGAWRSESLHLWSLSVEEQFYLGYPLLLYLTAVRHRTVMLLTVLAASILSRLWLMASYPASFYSALLPVVMEYFTWGCLFAWWADRGRLGRLPPGWILPVSGAGVVALLAVEFGFRLNGFFQFRTSHFQTPIAVLLGLFVWSLWTVDRRHVIARFLCWRPFVYFGTMSYTMYLVHLLTWDVYARLRFPLPFSPTVNALLGTFAITLALSMAIWHFVEHPANAMKKHVR